MIPFSCTVKCARRLAVALVAMASLIFAVGCGSSSNSGGGGGKNQGFTNASLNGHYAFTLRGFGLFPGGASEDYYVEGGVFTADGNGNVTAGTDDYVQSNVPFSDSVSGTYKINSDGTGDLQLNFGGGPGGRGGSAIYRITLSDTSDFFIEEDDGGGTIHGGGTSAGSGELQGPGVLSTTPSGTFVIRSHDLQVSATMARVVIAGTSVGGSYYMIQGGVPTTGSIAGQGNTISAPTNGRGALSYSINGTAHSLFYYIVNSGRFRLIDITPGILSIGLSEQQTATTLSAGSYAFGSSGETATPGFVNTVGVFTADGAGTLSGLFDSVQDGAVSSDIQVTGGSYLLNSDGSGTFSLGSGGVQGEVWIVSPSRAYFILVSGLNVEDGTADIQSGAFSNSSLGTQAAFFMDGWDGISVLFKDRVGTLTPNGSGSLSTAYITSFFDPNAGAGGNAPNAFSGTYAVSSNGRVTTQLNGFTNNIVLYLVSNSTGYMLQADAGVNIGGAFRRQTAP
jgi:hypothetical protein